MEMEGKETKETKEIKKAKKEWESLSDNDNNQGKGKGKGKGKKRSNDVKDSAPKMGASAKNEIVFKLPSLSVNEGVARAAVAAFCAQMDPSAAELADLKCVVSEAVTNCIVHGYRDRVGMIYITITLYDGGWIRLSIRDKGVGIADVKAARCPLFTTDAAGERSGMGFTVMESFTDRLRVISKPGKGTHVIMLKRLAGKNAL